MFEYPEVISLILCVSLYVFLLSLTRQYQFKLPGYWLVCITSLVLGEVFTVLENIFLFELMNLLEHVSFAVACGSFFIGILKYRGRNG